jgi:selenide,water dikinase|tara:strand:+ start:219 stop:1184 length:966 start_codon:yes stop_codon:yes gene_type:complete
VLSNIHQPELAQGAVGFDSSDDAAIYTLDDGRTIIQSVDFFTPIVDDPFTFGQIAAANSLSDIYAMGGTPLFALNVAAFNSDELPLSVLTDILNGGVDIAKEAGIPILGGHTIKDKEPKYGMVVTGEVHPDKLTRNDTAQVGDLLVLTKPLGTGIISTAIKRGVANENIMNTAIDTMRTLNKSAAEAMAEVGVNACTDITGYGLLGHLLEMCKGSNVSATIEFDSMPFIKGVFELAQEGVIPGGTKLNLEFVQDDINSAEHLAEFQLHMLADAQTSGGLLISVSTNKAEALVNALKSNGTLASHIIGEVQSNDGNVKVNIL